MVDGDLDAAKAVTHTKVTVMNDDGTLSTKQVLESLDSPRNLIAEPNMPERPETTHMDYDMQPMSPGPPQAHTKTYRVRKLMKVRTHP